MIAVAMITHAAIVHRRDRAWVEASRLPSPCNWLSCFASSAMAISLVYGQTGSRVFKNNTDIRSAACGRQTRYWSSACSTAARRCQPVHSYQAFRGIGWTLNWAPSAV